MSVSDKFMDALATRGELYQPEKPSSKRPKEAAPADDVNTYTVTAEDPSAVQEWEAERAARAAHEEAQAAKRKAKRDKKKAKKKQKGGGGGAAAEGGSDEGEDDDT
jgi:hypothetical protein